MTIKQARSSARGRKPFPAWKQAAAVALLHNRQWQNDLGNIRYRQAKCPPAGGEAVKVCWRGEHYIVTRVPAANSKVTLIVCKA